MDIILTPQVGLRIRLLEGRHAPSLIALIDRDRDDFSRWIPWVNAVTTLEEAERFIARGLQKLANGDGLIAGLWDDRELMGGVVLRYIDIENSETEIGYFLSRAARGRGIASRSCRALVDYAFSELELRSVLIKCAIDNKRSRAIPERLGFTMVRTEMPKLPEIEGDEKLSVYAMNRDRWVVCQ